MKSSAKNISLNSYDDIFSTEETRADDKREKVMEAAKYSLAAFRREIALNIADEKDQETQ